jgi:hypothetical protein
METYVKYLLIEPCYTACTALADIFEEASHDSVNRFLIREQYTPNDLYSLSSSKVDSVGGVLSVDDSILDKPHSDYKKAELIQFHYSGKHKRVVKGICIITLYYTDKHGTCVPVNYRLYNTNDNKTKNDYFREMLTEVLAWGLSPSCVTGDAWYSSLENLKFIRKNGLGMLFGIDSNRKISIEKGSCCQIQNLTQWPENGIIVYLKDFGMVRAFRQTCKDTHRYYIMAMPKLDMLDDLNYADFEFAHNAHWNIERFHRAVKQLCNIEKFQVRKTEAIHTHIFCSLVAFINLECMRIKNVIANWYKLKKEQFMIIVRDFVASHELDTFLKLSVNA